MRFKDATNVQYYCIILVVPIQLIARTTRIRLKNGHIHSFRKGMYIPLPTTGTLPPEDLIRGHKRLTSRGSQVSATPLIRQSSKASSPVAITIAPTNSWAVYS